MSNWQTFIFHDKRKTKTKFSRHFVTLMHFVRLTSRKFVWFVLGNFLVNFRIDLCDGKLSLSSFVGLAIKIQLCFTPWKNLGVIYIINCHKTYSFFHPEYCICICFVRFVIDRKSVYSDAALIIHQHSYQLTNL